jgi:hypothetical protein
MARKKKRMQTAVSVPIAPRAGYDGNPPVIEKVRDLEGEGKRTILREHRYDTIGWLLRHKRIEPYQESAARRLQDDAERASLANYVASGQGFKIGGPIVLLSDGKLAAMARHADAIAALRAAFDRLGSAGERLITLVVIDGNTLGKAAAIMKEPERGILLGLRVALDALARHYRLA